MLLNVITKDKQLYRTVTRTNIKKVAKSLYKEFPKSDYAALHAIITNGMEKNFEVLTLVDGRMKVGATILP